MKVSVFGLGYVGAVSCGCFARDGHEVIGVDLVADKVALINQGHAPIVEDGIEELIHQAMKKGRLTVTVDSAQAVAQSEISLISVGTPSLPGGGLDTQAVAKVSAEIGAALAHKDGRHLVAVRSTVMPGTVRSVVIPALEKASGKKAGKGFGVCFNPEFLREGSSVQDHYNPPFTVIGQLEPEDGRTLARLYEGISAKTYFTSLEEAEMIKYICNSFHALKVTFANEMGMLAQSLGVDSHLVMDIACQDTKLNISKKYLRPGFAFGGSCLPKDLRAILHHARTSDMRLPMLEAVLESNRTQVERAVDLVVGLKKKKVSILGLSFKAGTDDLRESPNVMLAEALIGKGFEVRIFDRHLSMARLIGANKAYIENEIPHITSLLVNDLAAAVIHGQVIIIGNPDPDFAGIGETCGPEQQVVDLCHFPGLAQGLGDRYHGITW